VSECKDGNDKSFSVSTQRTVTYNPQTSTQNGIFAAAPAPDESSGSVVVELSVVALLAFKSCGNCDDSDDHIVVAVARTAGCNISIL